VAATIAKLNRKGLAPWSVKATLTPLSRVLNSAVRRGLIGENPMRRLERGERPKVERREQRILRGDEIGTFLSAAPPRYRTLLATALSTGLREMELLGLTWGDVDFDRGVVAVRAQLSRITGERKPLKTGAAKREVPLTASIVRELKLHPGIASPHKAAADFVFATATGRPMGWSNVIRRGLHKAAEGLADPRPRFHDLRHTFASLLIGEGADVVYVSRAMGHGDPAVTLRVYSHLWAELEHGDKFRGLLDATLSAAVSTNG
jgi:integrase